MAVQSASVLLGVGLEVLEDITELASSFVGAVLGLGNVDFGFGF